MVPMDYFALAKGKKILIVGDAVVDKYILGTTTRVTPESPTPIIDINESNSYLGQLGIVFKYIKAFGGQAETCTVLGNDFEGNFFLKTTKELGIAVDGFLQKNIQTPQITRIKSWGQHVVQLEKRYDFDNALRTKINQEIINFVKERIEGVEVLLILDYNLGLFNQNFLLINNLFTIARDKRKKIIVLPDKGNIHLYTEGYLVKMNVNDAASILGITQINDTSIRIIGNKILNDTRFEGLFLTSLYDNSYYLSGEKVLTIPNLAPRPALGYAGAPSVQMSTLALMSAAGAPQEFAVKVASIAAAISIAKPSITYFPLKELQEAFESGKTYSNQS